MEMSGLIEKASRSTAEVIRGVKPAHFSRPTPCSELDVKALANHMAAFYGMAALAGARQPMPAGGPPADMVGESPASTMAPMLQQAVAAWQKPSAYEGMAQFGPLELPAQFAGSVVLFEIAVHGWDLAKGSGQQIKFDDDVVRGLEQVSQMIVTDDARNRGTFAAAVNVDGSAPLLDRVLAHTGRDPHWRG